MYCTSLSLLLANSLKILSTETPDNRRISIARELPACLQYKRGIYWFVGSLSKLIVPANKKTASIICLAWKNIGVIKNRILQTV